MQENPLEVEIIKLSFIKFLSTLIICAKIIYLITIFHCKPRQTLLAPNCKDMGDINQHVSNFLTKSLVISKLLSPYCGAIGLEVGDQILKVCWPSYQLNLFGISFIQIELPSYCQKQLSNYTSIINKKNCKQRNVCFIKN